MRAAREGKAQGRRRSARRSELQDRHRSPRASASDEYYLDSVPELPWEKVGGQEEALPAIRDAIELPLLHPDLVRRNSSTPRRKASCSTARPAAARRSSAKPPPTISRSSSATDGRGDARVLHAHQRAGDPQHVGRRSERMVREIFATAREKRREGYLPFLFIDEAESILGTRRASRYSNILSTLVPMFCTEMDGIESLNEVVIILASNRADLIDPAILRPGRIDRKIKVARPNKEGAREIYRIYLPNDLPYDPALLEGRGVESAAIDSAHRQADRAAIRSSRREPVPRDHAAQRKKGDALPRRPDQRRDHRQHRRARQRPRDQARHRQRQEEGISGTICGPRSTPSIWKTTSSRRATSRKTGCSSSTYDPENVVKVSPVRRRARRTKLPGAPNTRAN